MSLLVKRLGPACLLAFLFSCEDPNEIGLNLNPDLQNVNVFFTELPLDVSNLQMDSVNTTVTGRLLMGRIDDPTFGVSTVTAYTQARPGAFTRSLLQGAEFDSLVMTLTGTYFYGDGMEQTQTISIHQLTEGIVDTVRYYAFDSRPFNSESIGELSYTITGNRPDTLTISARMSDAFGAALFDAALNDSVAFRNSTNFDEYFKGLAFVPDQGSTMAFAANVEAAGSLMTLFYSDADDTVASAISFFFNAFSGQNFNGTSYFTNITADVSGTPLATITERYTEFDPVDNKVFSQAGNALYPKIKLDAFRDFVADNNVKINRADIVIEAVETFDDGFEPPESLFFFITNETNNLLPFRAGNRVGLRAIQAENAQQPFGVGQELVVPFQEDEERQFEGNVTIYIQLGIVDEFLQDPEDVVLVPSRFSSTLNRFSFDASNVKLRLFYSTFE